MSISSTAWTGNWQARALTGLNSRGYASILDYLRDNPAKPYLAVAEELGPDIVAMHLVRMEFEDAEREGHLRWAAMDCLARELREVFPNGWGKVHKPPKRSPIANERQDEIDETDEERIQFQKAKAIGIWVAMVGQVPTNAKPCLRAVWAALQELCPPVGWLPQGPDDPLIVGAFEKGWPVSASVERVSVGPHLICPKCNAVMAQPTETDLDQTCPCCGTNFPVL